MFMDEAVKDWVEVGIEYYGHFNKLAGKKFEKVKIAPRLKDGINDISRYLEENYSINQGFILMINNNSIIRLLKRNENVILLEKDVFKVIPILSGG